MPNELLERLGPVVTRLRGLRFWQCSGLAAWMIAAFAGGLWWLGGPSGEDSMRLLEVAAAIVITLGAALVIAAVAVQFLFRSPQSLARRIERRYPELQQRLITALDTANPPDVDNPLRRRLIGEASEHARHNDWPDVVSPARMRASQAFGVAGSAAALIFAGLLALGSPATPATASANRLARGAVKIMPGDVEIQRGTNLLVTAEFGFDVSSEPELIVRREDQTSQRIDMRQSLDDPVWGGLLAAVDQPLTYHLETPRWVSQSYNVEVFEYPAVVQSDAVLTYPSFTGEPSKRIQDAVRVTAVRGTEVTWWCRLNKPVDAATLVAMDKDQPTILLQPAADDPLWVSASIRLDQTQRFRVELLDDAGRGNRVATELVAKCLANGAPTLRLEPATDLTVSPLEEFEVAAEISDDHGILASGITVTFDQTAPRDIELGGELAAAATQRISHLIDMESLDAQPDQLLSFAFWADDRIESGLGDDAEIRRTHGDLFFAEVRPFEEIFREGQPPPGGQSQPSAQAAAAEELADLQKQIIQATWKITQRGHWATPQTREDINVLLQSQNDAVEQLDELASKINDEASRGHVEATRLKMTEAIEALQTAAVHPAAPSLATALAAEQAAYAGLLRLRAREFEVSRAKSSGSSAGNSKRQKQLDDLELKQDENRYETQQDAGAPAEQESAREVRQVLSRLSELARRQEDLNAELAQLQSALDMAQTEQERREIERQLKRLRDQQQDILRQSDELASRMREPQNAESMNQAAEQLEQTRENIRQSSEALTKQDASAALAAGTRAQRQLEQTRDEVRQRAAGQLDERMRALRNAADQLDRQQSELAERMESSDQPDAGAGLRGQDDRAAVVEDLAAQKAKLNELLDDIKTTVEQAEESEPLLAQSLYDAFRQAGQKAPAQRLDNASELFKRGYDAQARDEQQQAAGAVRQLREQIDAAAQNVLGNDTQGLQRAASLLEQLEKAAEAEVRQGLGEQPGSSQASGERSGQASSPPQPGASSSQSESPSQGQSSSQGQSPGGQPGQTPAAGEQASGSATRTPGDGSPPGRPTPGQGGGPPRLRPTAGAAGGANSPSAGSSPIGDPLAGGGFRQWSDGLRDVEEMVADPELRSRATRIRERARDARAELQRGSQTPRWESLEEMIVTPLRELRRDVSEELMRRSAQRQALVPIDRDPVPDQYAEATRQYYERLGSGR